MSASRSYRPHSTPIPVGPSILCPVNAMKSASSAATSTGRCGTDCEQSSSTLAPTSWARAMIADVGLIVPRMLDMCT